MSKVSIVQDDSLEYPKEAPFNPSIQFPELNQYDFECDKNNMVYGKIREALFYMGLDKENYGTKSWNPLQDYINENETVILKPNLVSNVREEIQNAVTTHASVIRPIIDYCWKAMNGKGKIIIGDAPSAEANFDLLIEQSGIKKMVSFLKSKGINIEVKDFRSTKVIMKDGIWVGEQKNVSSENEYVIVDLAEKSMFNCEKYKNADLHGGGYNRITTNEHHHNGKHEYCVSKAILEADVVISIPKLKTHKKAGLTCCMKNLVGINVDKDYLPHFIVGPVNSGGDEFPLLEKKHVVYAKVFRKIRDIFLVKHWKHTGKIIASLLSILKTGKNEKKSTNSNKSGASSFVSKVTGTDVFQGAWSGNDTIWRMILDLNRIFAYCDANGELHNKKVRRYLYVIDGIVAGGGNGPKNPIPTSLGIVAVATEAYDADTSLLNYLGVDSNKILLYKNSANYTSWLSDENELELFINGKKDSDERLTNRIVPPDNWEF